MSNQMVFYTGVDIAARACVNYARVLNAIHTGSLPALKIGNSYVVQAQDAEAWIKQQALLADPEAITRLQAEVARLKAENHALRQGRV